MISSWETNLYELFKEHNCLHKVLLPALAVPLMMMRVFERVGKVRNKERERIIVFIAKQSNLIWDNKNDKRDQKRTCLLILYFAICLGLRGPMFPF